jgi:iron complex outermembrane recepter protein
LNHKIRWVTLLVTSACLGEMAHADASAAEGEALEEVLITASLRSTPLRELPQSATVLDSETLRAAGVQHFEDVIGLIPGLSWASGTSRPRYFQIRGIGEVEQYQGAPNPSVGFLIDDIDFSGVGMPATLFDLDRIEVLRGPSSTVYGANALAGLISVRGRDPGREFELGGEATLADYGTAALGVVAGDGRTDGTAGWRLAAQRYQSDGFRQNAYLRRDSTNGYDESTVRAKLAWDPNSQLHAALTLLYADIDNGYDAWSVDNSRVTLSNQPGRDAQRSSGGALRLDYTTRLGTWRSVTSAAHSDIDYSFDGDWGNDQYWGAYAPYDYFEGHRRTRSTVAQDLRFVGNGIPLPFGSLSPVLGAYLLRLREDDVQLDTWSDQYYGAGQSTLISNYQANNVALYGSLEMPTDLNGKLSLGLRGERRTADYADSSDEPFPQARSQMVGGNLSWLWEPSAARRYYVTLARGYKAGGFNIGADIDPAQRQFGAETLWNLELGLRATEFDGNLDLQADIYAMRRTSMQVYNSRQLLPNNPLTYVFYTDNAAHGDNAGLEAELHWRPQPHWMLAATAALQDTRYLGYVNDGLDLRGREQAFAPPWQASLSAEYQHPAGAFLRADLQGQDGFYFSSSHDQKARARNLLNLRVGWRTRNWTASLWAHNLFNTVYSVQGFYFGDEPPDFPVKLYLQNGDPRQVGATLSVTWGAH